MPQTSTAVIAVLVQHSERCWCSTVTPNSVAALQLYSIKSVNLT